MSSHLKALLESEEYREVASKSVSARVWAHFSALKFNIQATTTLNTEADVAKLANSVSSPVTAMYTDLTGGTIEARGEILSLDRLVRTDLIYQSGVGDKDIILWENKKPTVGEHYVRKIVGVLSESSMNFDHVARYEHEKAIIAKVCMPN